MPLRIETQDTDAIATMPTTRTLFLQMVILNPSGERGANPSVGRYAAVMLEVGHNDYNAVGTSTTGSTVALVVQNRTASAASRSVQCACAASSAVASEVGRSTSAAAAAVG